VTETCESLSELWTEGYGHCECSEKPAGHQSFDHYCVEAGQHESPPERWWRGVSPRSVTVVN